MELWSVVFLFFGVDLVFCQWHNRVTLVDFQDYFQKVMTMTIHELEERHWSNLKLNDYSNVINEQMYKWHVTGNITYTNGFLVSVENIHISGVQQQTASRTVDGVAQTSSSVQGIMHFTNVKIGYDVLAQLDVEGEHTYTGTYTHATAQFQFWIMKNLNTQEITTSFSLASFPSGLHRMIYMPASHLTEVISRTYVPNQASGSVHSWGRDIIQPIVLDVATNKIPFPDVCLDCR